MSYDHRSNNHIILAMHASCMVHRRFRLERIEGIESRLSSSTCSSIFRFISLLLYDAAVTSSTHFSSKSKQTYKETSALLYYSTRVLTSVWIVQTYMVLVIYRSRSRSEIDHQLLQCHQTPRKKKLLQCQNSPPAFI